VLGRDRAGGEEIPTLEKRKKPENSIKGKKSEKESLNLIGTIGNELKGHYRERIFGVGKE